MIFLTWNVAGIGKSIMHELELVSLLCKRSISAAAITETEIHPGETFSIPGYTTFSHPTGPHKTRVIILVRTDIAVATEAMLLTSSLLDVWAKLTIRGHPLIFGGVDHQWKTISDEKQDLITILDHCKEVVAAAKT